MADTSSESKFVSDQYIEANVSPRPVSGDGATAGAAADTVALHYFGEVSAHFSSLLPDSSGLQYTLTATQTEPTLALSRTTAFFGTSVSEYTAVTMYVVPKIHASNLLPPTEASDLEIVVEHIGEKPTDRLFLCAVVSPFPDGGAVADAKGNDAGFAAFVRAIVPLRKTTGQSGGFGQISSGGAGQARQQFRVDNNRLVPTAFRLSFPGTSESVFYRDADKNAVLVVADPLLLPPALFAVLAAPIDRSAAPVFPNFDLVPPAEGAAFSRIQFQSNLNIGGGIGGGIGGAAKTSPVGSLNALSAPNTSGADDAPSQSTEGFRGKCAESAATKDRARAASAEFALYTMAVALAILPAGILVWHTAGELYRHLLGGAGLVLLGTPAVSEVGNAHVWMARAVIGAVVALAISLVSAGGAMRNWPMLLAGMALVFLYAVFLTSLKLSLLDAATAQRLFGQIRLDHFSEFLRRYYPAKGAASSA